MFHKVTLGYYFLQVTITVSYFLFFKIVILSKIDKVMYFVGCLFFDNSSSHNKFCPRRCDVIIFTVFIKKFFFVFVIIKYPMNKGFSSLRLLSIPVHKARLNQITPIISFLQTSNGIDYQRDSWYSLLAEIVHLCSVH